MNTKLAAFAFLIASTFAVHAADLGGRRVSTMDTPEEPITHTWTGPWVGAVLGYNFSNTEADFSEQYEEGSYNFLHINGLGAQGFFGELQGGFDYQISERLVVSLFGGMNLSNAKFEGSALNGYASVKQTQDWGGVVGPRVGALISPSTMVYVAGGLAYAELGDVEVRFGDSHKSFKSDAQIGGFGELGLESKLAEHTALKVFGRYTGFGDYELKGVEGVELNNSQLVGGVAITYKFN